MSSLCALCTAVPKSATEEDVTEKIDTWKKVTWQSVEHPVEKVLKVDDMGRKMDKDKV